MARQAPAGRRGRSCGLPGTARGLLCGLLGVAWAGPAACVATAGTEEFLEDAAEEAWPHAELTGGGRMPLVGFGTNKADTGTLLQAFRAGYRHLDGALEYGTHWAIREAIQASALPREEFFITTKVGANPPTYECCFGWLSLRDPLHPPKGTPRVDAESNAKGRELEGMELSLRQLNLSYADLCMIHRPAATALELHASLVPHWQLIGLLGTPQRRMLQWALNAAVGLEAAGSYGKGEESRAESWRQLEEAKRRGLCRHLGLSNYPLGSLRALEARAREPVEVLQLEYSPTCQFRAILDYARARGIAVMGYGTTSALIVASRRVSEIANRYSRTPNQVVLRWRLEKDVGVLQATRRAERFKENTEALSIALAAGDVAALDALNAGGADGCLFYDMSWYDSRGAGATVSALQLLCTTVGFVLLLPLNGPLCICCWCCCCWRFRRRRKQGEAAPGKKET